MKRKDLGKALRKLFSEKDFELLQESLRYRISSVNMERNDFENKLYLLKLEYQKKYKELILEYNTDRNKLISQHQNRSRQLQFQ